METFQVDQAIPKTELNGSERVPVSDGGNPAVFSVEVLRAWLSGQLSPIQAAAELARDEAEAAQLAAELAAARVPAPDVGQIGHFLRVNGAGDGYEVLDPAAARAGLGAQTQGAALDQLADLGLTAGDLLYVAGDGTVSALPAGTAGQVLGVAGGLPAWVAGGFNTYESGEIAIVASGPFTLSHSLGRKPLVMGLYLRCKTAEAGWSVGDEVAVSFQQTTNQGAGIRTTDTQIIGRFGSASSPFIVPVASTGSGQNITVAYWALIVRAL